MKVYDLKAKPSHPYEDRDKNVFHKAEQFKARIIELPANGDMPACEMKSHVVFYVISGAATVSANEKSAILEEGQCLITEPATLSMKTTDGVRIMGIQIEAPVPPSESERL